MVYTRIRTDGELAPRMVKFGPFIAVYLCLQSHVHAFMVSHTVLAPRDMMFSISTALYEFLGKAKWLAEDDNLLVFNVSDFDVEPVQMHHTNMRRIKLTHEHIADFFKHAMMSRGAGTTLALELSDFAQGCSVAPLELSPRECDELWNAMSITASANMGRLTELSYVGSDIDVAALPAAGTVPPGWINTTSQ